MTNYFDILEYDTFLMILLPLSFSVLRRFASTHKNAARVARMVLCEKLKLDDTQYSAFCNVMRGENVLITGCAGTGKSHLLSVIRRYLPIQGTSVTASTGCAAANIDGLTLHSALGVGIARPPAHVIAHNIVENNKYAKNDIRALKTLIVDEAFMLTAEFFDKIAEVVSLVRRRQSSQFASTRIAPFETVQVVLIGDALQLPPVDVDAGKWLWKSSAFKLLSFEEHMLTTVHRQSADVPFIQVLQRVRTGDATKEDFDYLVENSAREPDDDAIRLFAVNRTADAYNDHCLRRVAGTTHVFNCLDTVLTKAAEREGLSGDNLLPAKLFKNCKAPQQLCLKVGARVMALKNMDTVHNGSLGTVTDITKHEELDSRGNPVAGSTVMMVKVLFDATAAQSKSFERRFFSHRANQPADPDNTFGVEGVNGKLAERIQLPLRLAYGISMHKSQGHTFEKCFIDFANTFTSGQAYVALSRVKTLANAYLKDLHLRHLRMVDKEAVDFCNNL